MTKSRLLLFLTLVALIASFFALGFNHYLTLDFFQSQQVAITEFYHTHPLSTALYYLGIYVIITGLSLPGAALMTLAGGAIFGFLQGTLLVSFASTIGATLAFLSSRFLFQESVQNRFGEKLKTINQGIEKDGNLYLFSLRLVPIFPFFMVNLIMGVTPMKVIPFFIVSQIGMLAGTVVFVNAGVQISQLDSLTGILSPGVLASFALLGIFPLIAQWIINTLKTRKIYNNYPKPKSFDRNLIVIGAGSAGLVTSYIAAAVKSKVTLIEKHKMGGDCLNTGCVPSKALIRSAHFLAQAQRAQSLGFKSAQVDFEFADVFERIQRVIKTIEPHDSMERYTQLGVECIQGSARISSPYTVEVNGQTLTTKNIVIATGARPQIPTIPGIEKMGYLTSDTVWNLRQSPNHLLVLGAGPIGCELVQAFARLRVPVTLVLRGERILKNEDPEVSELIIERFRSEGITVLTGHALKRFYLEDGVKKLLCRYKGQEVTLTFDQLLVATGRQANVDGFGLEELGVTLRHNGTVEANDFLQTNFPNLYVCGDVTGPYQFTHTAAHQAWYVAVNALFSPFKRFRVDYSVIPWCTFTDPEVARVGINESEAKQRNIPYEITTYGLDDLDRAITDEEAHGFVKILTVPGKDRILGATIVGSHSGELITEFVSAMKHKIGLNNILGTIHIYPTFSEANKYTAGNWKRAHKPERLMPWLEKFHAWRR